MAEWPRITVATPSFNQAPYLREAIESVLDQDYPNLEYLVIDGGSTDESVGIIREYASRLAWWVSEKDGGQSHALNKGFRRATGEWLNWINSDDVLFPGALRAVGEAVAGRRDIDLAAGINAVGDASGRIRSCRMPASPRSWNPRHGLMAAGQQSTFFRAEAYRRVGGVNEALHMRMDMDLYLRILKSGGRGIVVPALLGFFRHTETAKRTTRVDVYEREVRAWRREDGISPAQAALARFLLRVRCVFDGSYLRSMAMNRRVRGRSMAELWREARQCRTAAA